MSRKMLVVLSVLFTFPTASQLVHDSLLIDGHHRSFHYVLPARTANASIVFVLHGSGGSGERIRNGAAKLEAIRDKENIIMVYPDGYKNYWNECRKMATSAANLENVDEGAFFSGMIDYFASRYHADLNHVFAVGTSGGGHMAYKLAITLPAKFKAITAIVANLPDSANMDCSESLAPMPVMIINGTADSTNPYNGGEVKVTGVVLGTVRSTEQTLAYWATVDGYRGRPTKQKLPDTDPKDGKTIEQYTYRKKGKPEVVLLKVINGHHDYPNDIDVYLEAWNFFKRQMLVAKQN